MSFIVYVLIAQYRSNRLAVHRDELPGKQKAATVGKPDAADFCLSSRQKQLKISSNTSVGRTSSSASSGAIDAIMPHLNKIPAVHLGAVLLSGSQATTRLGLSPLGDPKQ